jgi:hypothetical protein
MFTEIFQTILLVRQEDFVDVFSTDQFKTGYELRPQNSTYYYR